MKSMRIPGCGSFKRLDAKEAENCHRAVEDVLQLLIRFGPTPAELETAQRHLRADLLIEADDPDSVMERLAREAIHLKPHPSLPERADGVLRRFFIHYMRQSKGNLTLWSAPNP